MPTKSDVRVDTWPMLEWAPLQRSVVQTWQDSVVLWLGERTFEQTPSVMSRSSGRGIAQARITILFPLAVSRIE